MNFSYFKEKNLTLKHSILVAILTIPALFSRAQDYNNIEFVENKGQWDSRVKFRGEVNAGAFFIRSGGFTVLQHNREELAAIEAAIHHSSGTGAARNKPLVLHSHSWNVDFVNASPQMRVIPDKPVSSHNNYFLGSDPSKWASNCKIYQAVTLENVYPNIDVRYYTHNGTLKYDILVKPGGNVNKIALKYDGIDKLQVKNKELVIGTSLGEMKESSPFTYQAQVDGKSRREINCRYTVKDNILKFDVKDYDPNATLIIDPSMIFCSFSGSTTDNWGYTATYGPDGSMFGGGVVREGNGWPVSPGAFQTTWGGGDGASSEGPCDIGIIKLSPNGSQRIYATYVGGSGNEQPHSLVVDGAGNLVLAGRTNSPNYPVTGPGGQVGSGGGFDIVVTKLNSAGSALVGSKKIGGAASDGVKSIMPINVKNTVSSKQIS